MTTRIWVGALLTVFVALTITAHVRWAARAGAADVPGEMAPNEFGVAESVHRTGLVDRSNPSSWSWGSTAVRANRVTTGGPAGRSRRHSPGASSRPPTAWPPCFASTMPAARPDADIATLEARREAFATVLKRGVTRFLRTIPATADFEVIAVDDPYEFSTPAQFSNFRRPNPIANVALESSIRAKPTLDPSDGGRLPAVGPVTMT